MKKIPTLLKREFENHRVVNITPELTSPDLASVLAGEGIATEKIDGACCAMIDGRFYKRYDAKKNKNGIVEDHAGKNDVVLCPAHWYNFCFDDSFGCIVNSALRYAVGRHSYMPGVVRNFIRKYKNVLDEKTIAVAIRDIDNALCHDETDDADEWKKLRDELQKRLHEKQEI